MKVNISEDGSINITKFVLTFEKLENTDMLSEKMNNICDSFGKKIGIDPDQISEDVEEEEEEQEEKEEVEKEDADESQSNSVLDISIKIGDIDTDDINIGTDEGFIELARRIKNRFCK